MRGDGRIVRDEDFAECYSERMGRPSIPPSLLAKVLLLQYRCGLSDEQAMESVAWDLRWKVALGLPVDHRGWHPTSLTKYRARLLLHGKERLALECSLRLAGELGMEAAIPALSRQLDHADERVRKAVALGLAKIGSRNAAEPLRRALRDKSPEVRMQVALGIGGRKSSALAMPLVVAMDEETDEAVQRELVLALGRIGSADAVQALIKFAQPTGRIFGRKPVGLRVAAVEALRLAATPAAVGTLQGLSDDGDKQVRAAARTALKELKRQPRG